MRWASLLTLCCLLCSLPAFAQETLTQADIRELQEDLQKADRTLRDYDQLLVDLNKAADKTSKSARKKAIQRIEEIQGRVILALEERLDEEYKVIRHGEEAAQVDTREAEELSSGSSPRQKRTVAEKLSHQGVASPGYRLVRMQQIYVSLQQSRQQAIDREPTAFDRYYRLAREFGGLMLYERNGMYELLPPEAQKEYEETMVP